MVHQFHASILREYDIRGTVGKTLSAKDALAIGRGFARFIQLSGGWRVCIGRDGRLSSPELAAAVTEGLCSQGVEVIDVGLGPTPMLYFAVKHCGVDGGIMVTGSHNPGDDNGFKMALKGRPFYGEDIQKLAGLAASETVVAKAAPYQIQDLRHTYANRLLQDLTPATKKLRIAWDAGNGAAAEILRLITQGGNQEGNTCLEGEHILLNDTIDGTFPSHHPDPTVPRNLQQLQQVVLSHGCDLGIAFDGDGDRLGVIDGKGRILWGDQLMMLFARDVLQQNPGATIIADVKASQALFDEIARLGGKSLMWKTGHSLIKSKLAETGALLAGEMSGHIFFADRYYGYDDALYAAVRLVGLLEKSALSLADLYDQLPQLVNTPELRIPCDEVKKFAFVEAIKGRLKKQGALYQDMDGVRVQTSDGWWLLRASNTQSVLVARCESADLEGLNRLKAEIVRYLHDVGLTPVDVDLKAG